MALHHKEVTEKTIGAAFEVHNELGYGFLEKVYQKAMQVELIQRHGDGVDHLRSAAPLENNCTA